MYKTNLAVSLAPGQSLMQQLLHAWRTWSASPCTSFAILLNAPLTKGQSFGVVLGDVLLVLALLLPTMGVASPAGWAVALVLAAGLLMYPGPKCFAEKGEE